MRTSATGVLTKGQVDLLERAEALQTSQQLRSPTTALPLTAAFAGSGQTQRVSHWPELKTIRPDLFIPTKTKSC